MTDAQTIAQAILATYLQPLDKIIERRAAWYLALSDKDMFAMPEEESKKHQRRLNELAEEIEIFTNIKSAIEQMHLAYHAHAEELETVVGRYHNLAHNLALDVVTLKEVLISTGEIEIQTLNCTIQRLSNERT